MRTILALFSALFLGTAIAQSDPGHMIEFNAENLVQTTLSFDKSRSKGVGTDSDTQLDFNMNYAYALPWMRKLQLGTRINYNKGTEPGFGDFENYGVDVGAIYNMSGQNRTGPIDLMNSAYVSLYLGLGWANEYSGISDRKDEFTKTTLALGKRFDLRPWGVNHVSYSPEIAFQAQNSTTGSSLEYSQSVQLRLLQFSVLW